MKNAPIAQDKIAIIISYDGKALTVDCKIAIISYDGKALTVDCPNGWEDVKKMTRLVLDYQEQSFVYSGWNSDSNMAYFKPDSRKYATIVK